MKLAELLIDIRANSATLRKDFTEMRGQVNHFAQHVKWRLENIGISLGAFGIARAMQGLVDFEDQIKHTAEATGMTVEKFAELTEALKVYDISQTGASQALAYFDKIISGLVRSKAGVTALGELGLKLKDLQKMEPHAALLRVADAFAKVKDGTQKAGIAAALFENTYGLQLIPFLNQGAAGIEKLESKFSGLGEAQGRAVNAAERLKLAETELSAAATQLGIKTLPWLANGLLGVAHPALLVEGLLLDLGEVAAKVSETFFEAQEKMAGWLHLPVGNFVEGANYFRSVIAEAESMKAELAGKLGIDSPEAMSAHGMGIELPATVKTKIDRVSEALRALHEQLTGLGQGDVAKGLEHLKDLGANSAQLKVGGELLRQIQDVKAWDEAVKKSAAAHRAAGKEYAGVLSMLDDQINQSDPAIKNYLDTMAKLDAIGIQGIDVTKGRTEAEKVFRDAILKNQAAIERSMFKKIPNIQAAAITMPAAPEFKGVEGIFKKLKFDLGDLNKLGKQWGNQMSDSMTRIIETGQGFRSLLQDLMREFESFMLKKFVFAELAQGLGGTNATGFSGLLSGFFGGLAGKAAGGPVTAGELYMVGESGPELFAPGESGAIIPNGAGMSRASGPTTNNYIDARGSDAGIFVRLARMMESMQRRNAGNALVATYEYQARGGAL